MEKSRVRDFLRLIAVVDTCFIMKSLVAHLFLNRGPPLIN